MEQALPMTRNERIASLYQAGHSQHAIAKTVGLSQPGVRKILFRLGWLTPKKGETRGEERVNPPPLDPDNQIKAVPSNENQSEKPASSLDALLRQVLAPGAHRCGFCHGWFLSRRSGQKYCCNICGHKGEGLHPVVPELHTNDCPLLVITG